MDFESRGIELNYICMRYCEADLPVELISVNSLWNHVAKSKGSLNRL